MKSRNVKREKRKDLPLAKSDQAKGGYAHRQGSKQQSVLDLLQRPEGSTVATIAKATGWQHHSVRGFLAGVVRKKLGLNLVSDKAEDGRIYRIAAAKGERLKKTNSRKSRAG